MAKAIDISVIIAAYNVESYIERAIQSALSQEGVGLEVIVVDDCSSDETVNIVRSIKDKRLVLVQHDVNQGPGAARNTAIEKAKGQWIAVLDGDDVFEEVAIDPPVDDTPETPTETSSSTPETTEVEPIIDVVVGETASSTPDFELDEFDLVIPVATTTAPEAATSTEAS